MVKPGGAIRPIHAGHTITRLWEKTEMLSKTLVEAAKIGSNEMKFVISELAGKDRVDLPGLPKTEDVQVVAKNEPKVNLKKIMDKQGQVGEMSIEDISIALGEIKGDLSKGPALFAKQDGACHAEKGWSAKGTLSRTDRRDYGCGPDCHEYSSSGAEICGF